MRLIDKDALFKALGVLGNSAPSLFYLQGIQDAQELILNFPEVESEET